MRNFVMAAGYGTRLAPLTLVRPKALVPWFSFPLLDIVLHNLPHGCRGNTLINVHHGSDLMHTNLESRIGVTILNEPTILGTGGGIANAAQHVDEGDSLLVHNVDILHDIDLDQAVRRFESEPEYVIMLLHRHPEFMQVHIAGDCITGFGDGGDEAYTGMMLLSPEALRDLRREPQFSIIGFLQGAIAQGKGVKGWRVKPGLWLDAGRTSDYLRVHADYREDVEFAGRMDGILPQSPTVVGDTFIGRNVIISSGADVSRSVLWDDVCIESGCVSDSVLCDGVTVNSSISKVIVL